MEPEPPRISERARELLGIDCRVYDRLSRLKARLEKLSDDLRSGAADSDLLLLINAEAETVRDTGVTYLLRYQKLREILGNAGNGSTGCNGSRELDSTQQKKYPDKKIVERLARLGLKRQLFAYLSRFSTCWPEGLAVACETLQMGPLNHDLNVTMSEPSGISPGDKLNFFRLAQKIRNEHGLTRRNSPPNCFRSFEDIIGLERDIDSRNMMSFFFQCIDLKLVDLCHVQMMYAGTSNVTELEALYSRQAESSPESTLDEANRRFDEQFIYLVTTKPSVTPMWPLVKAFLQYYDRGSFSPPEFVFGIVTADEELDLALNCLLNHALERYELRGITPNARTIRLYELLLKRGATLYFKDPDGGKSSLEALVELSRDRFRNFPLSKFSRYICCPLMQKKNNHTLFYDVVFDVHRSAPLSCLAARRLCHIRTDLELPRSISLFIHFHKELVSQVEPGRPPKAFADLYMRLQLDRLS